MRKRQSRGKILEDGGEGIQACLQAKGKKPSERKIEGIEEMESEWEAKF